MDGNYIAERTPTKVSAKTRTNGCRSYSITSPSYQFFFVTPCSKLHWVGFLQIAVAIHGASRIRKGQYEGIFVLGSRRRQLKASFTSSKAPSGISSSPPITTTTVPSPKAHLSWWKKYPANLSSGAQNYLSWIPCKSWGHLHPSYHQSSVEKGGHSQLESQKRLLLTSEIASKRYVWALKYESWK